MSEFVLQPTEIDYRRAARYLGYATVIALTAGGLMASCGKSGGGGSGGGGAGSNSNSSGGGYINNSRPGRTNGNSQRGSWFRDAEPAPALGMAPATAYEVTDPAADNLVTLQLPGEAMDVLVDPVVEEPVLADVA